MTVPGFAPQSMVDFRAQIKALTGRAGGLLEVTGQDIFDTLNIDHVNAVLRGHVGQQPVLPKLLPGLLRGLVGGAGMGGVATAEFAFDIAKTARQKRFIAKAAPRITIRRSAAGLKEKERVALSGMALLWDHDRIDAVTWGSFYCALTWNGGREEIVPSAKSASDSQIMQALSFLQTICKNAWPEPDGVTSRAGQLLNDVAKENTALGKTVDRLIRDGARWMDVDDIASSSLTDNAMPQSLFLGTLEGKKVYFSGNESLATIANAGTGKSTAQVIPNLLTYPGSCFVLDVKDELYAATAGHRQKFGPVYRFAPTDPAGYTHRYNPFDLIPRTVADAERECQIIASMLIPESPDAREPYWTDKAREYLWALSMLVAFGAVPDARNFLSVSRLFSVQTKFQKMAGYPSSQTKLVIEALQDLDKKIGMPALSMAANAILNGLDTDSNALESVFDTARSKLNPITRSPTTAAAMMTSDWHPLDLRRRPGTTVYLCLKPDEMRAYAPLVRLVFQQHVSQLTRNFKPQPGQLPVTFFLDEMPQLGYMPNLPDIIEVGRGAGLRLWMIMQYPAQLRDTYKAKAQGLIEACKVRCYMQPDPDASKDLSYVLGETLNIFTGEKRPLVQSHEFTGPAYKDRTITLSRGDHPASLGKVFSFKDPVLKGLMNKPLPVIRGRTATPVVKPNQPTSIAHGQPPHRANIAAPAPQAASPCVQQPRIVFPGPGEV